MQFDTNKKDKRTFTRISIAILAQVICGISVCVCDCMVDRRYIASVLKMVTSARILQLVFACACVTSVSAQRVINGSFPAFPICQAIYNAPCSVTNTHQVVMKAFFYFSWFVCVCSAP